MWRRSAVEHLVYGDAAVLGNDSGRAHLVEGGDGSLNEVVGVGRALALGKHIGDAHALEDGTHSATGLHTGTVGSGLEDHTRAAKLGHLLVGDSALVDGNTDEIFLSSFYALGDSSLYFIGFAEAPANYTVFVAYDNDSGESECTATLGHLGDTVDSYEAVLEVEVGG